MKVSSAEDMGFPTTTKKGHGENQKSNKNSLFKKNGSGSSKTSQQHVQLKPQHVSCKTAKLKQKTTEFRAAIF